MLLQEFDNLITKPAPLRNPDKVIEDATNLLMRIKQSEPLHSVQTNYLRRKLNITDMESYALSRELLERGIVKKVVSVKCPKCNSTVTVHFGNCHALDYECPWFYYSAAIDEFFQEIGLRCT